MASPALQPERAASSETPRTAQLDHSDAQTEKTAAGSGSSSVLEPVLQKEKTHSDVAPESAVAATKTKSHASGIGHVASRVASGPQLPGALKLVAIVAAIALALFLVALDMTIVATAIPKITDEFHSLNDVGWYGSAFFLTVASFQALWGKAYKYFPLKTSYLIAMFIFEVGSLICAVSKNSVTLIVGRSIAGLGGAGIAAGCYVIVAFSVSPAKRPIMMGIMGVVYGVASVVGPLLGGAFTTYSTWRWAFYVNLPIGGAAAGIIFLTFQPPPQAKPVPAPLKEKILQMDLPGTFVILGAIICFLLAIQYGGTVLPWSDKTVVGLLVGFGVLLICAGAIEYYSGERAMLLGRLLRVRNIGISCVYSIFFGGSFFLLLYYLPLYFQSVDGVTAADSGVRNLPLVIGVAVFTILSGGIISATGQAVPTYFIGAILACIGNGLLYTLDIGSPSSQWIGYQALAGIGQGISIQTPIMMCQASVEPVDISTVTAMLLFFQTIGGAVWLQAAQSAFTNTLINRLAEYAPNVSPARVLATGASDVVRVFQGADLDGVLRSYMAGLRVAYAISIALAGTSVLTALGLKWKRISLPKEGPAGGA